jgi:hypothetical protein
MGLFDFEATNQLEGVSRYKERRDAYATARRPRWPTTVTRSG